MIQEKIRAFTGKMTRDTVQGITIGVVLIAAMIIFWSISPDFLSFDNLHSVLLTAVPVGLIAIGECVLVMGGYFDMSVGMVASFAGLFTGLIVKSGGSVGVAVLIALCVGLFSGAIAGIAVSWLGMNAFITTFAMMQIYRGLIFIWTQGLPQPMFADIYKPFIFWGQFKLFGVIQFPIIILLVTYFFSAMFMKYAKTGRSVYLIGSNARAAFISGVNVRNVRVFMFMFSGALSALAGILLTMRVASAQPFVGDMYAMEAIAATIVGGTSMAGGKGNLGLTFVGVMIVYIIKNGLIMVGLPDFYQYIAIGAILFLAVFAQTQRNKV